MCLLIFLALGAVALVVWLAPYLLALAVALVVIVGATQLVAAAVDAYRERHPAPADADCLAVTGGLAVASYRCNRTDQGLVVRVKLRNLTDAPITLTDPETVDVQVWSLRGPVPGNRWFWSCADIPARSSVVARLRVPVPRTGHEVDSWAIACRPGEYVLLSAE